VKLSFSIEVTYTHFVIEDARELSVICELITHRKLFLSSIIIELIFDRLVDTLLFKNN